MLRLKTAAAALLVIAVAAPGCSRNKDVPIELAPSRMTTIGVNAYLWRAALDTISFAPLLQADANGGVIITDWYANPQIAERAGQGHGRDPRPGLRADALRVTAVAPGQPGRPVGQRAGFRRDRPEARGHHPHSCPRPSPHDRPRIRPTYDRPIRSGRRGRPLAGPLGRSAKLRRRYREPEAQDLRPRDVPLSLGPHPHGPRTQLHDGRRARALPPDAGPSKCFIRWAGMRSACRPRMRRWSGASIPAPGPVRTSRPCATS